MGLKQICIAFSLPVLAFLSLYWIRQRKKIATNDESNESIEVKSCSLNKSTVEPSNGKIIENECSSDQCLNEKLSPIDQSVNNESLINLTKRSLNNSIKDSINDSTNDSSNDSINDSTNDSTTDLVNSIIDSSPIKSSDLSLTNVINLTNNHLSGDSINLNNNDDTFKSKSNEHVDNSLSTSIDQQSIKESNQSIEDKSIQQLNLQESNEDKSIKQQNESIVELNSNANKKLESRNQSLVEGEEAFEINQKSVDGSTMDGDSLHYTDFTNESKDNTTFNTANDSSLNATINTTIGSMPDTTLDSANCSTKTLRSLPNDSSCGVVKEETQEDATIAQLKIEEVKEDYLNEENKVMNSTTNANSMEVKHDDISVVENDEKFLNVTEHEFKNDSKIEAVNEVIEELKNKVSEEMINDNEKKDDKSQLNNSIESNESTLNKSEDDSIVCVFEGPVEKKSKVEPKTASIVEQKIEEPKINAAKSTLSNQSSSVELPSASGSKVDLDESEDLEVLFEAIVENNKSTKKLNGQLNNNQNNNRSNHHNNNKSHQRPRSRQASKENDTSSNIITEYWFEMPKQLCGLFIGKNGSNINGTMKQSNTLIQLKDHPTALDQSLCMIRGREHEINEALSIIRSRFPVKKFPQVTLKPTNPNIIQLEPVSQNCSLILPEGINLDVLVSDFITPNHLFLQQPTHPTFMHLQRLNDMMNSTYKFEETPHVDELHVGIICAVQRDDWYRAIVTNFDQNNCVVRLLDYGSQMTVAKKDIRQVKRDFMSIPFQATECFLAHVQPINGVWSPQSYEFLREITKNQILQAIVVSYTEQQVPLIELIKMQNNKLVLINQEICANGFGIWHDPSNNIMENNVIYH